MTDKAVAKKAPTAVMTVDYGADAEACQAFDASELAIPRLQIVQAMSRAVTEGTAMPGTFLNTVTKKQDKVVDLLPLAFRHTFIEWGVRENGGGFVADRGLAGGRVLKESTVRDSKNRDILHNGNQLVETFEWYAYQLSNGGPTPVVLSFFSTTLKKCRALNTMIDQRRHNSNRVPPFGQVFKMSLDMEKNAQGSWFVHKFEPVGLIEEVENGAAIYAMAKADAERFRNAVETRADYGQSTGDASDGSDDTPF